MKNLRETREFFLLSGRYLDYVTMFSVCSSVCNPCKRLYFGNYSRSCFETRNMFELINILCDYIFKYILQLKKSSPRSPCPLTFMVRTVLKFEIFLSDSSESLYKISFFFASGSPSAPGILFLKL